MSDIPLCEMYVDDEIKNTALEVLEGRRYIKGQQNASLEKEFSFFCGVKHAIAVNSGTSALLLAAHVLDLKPNDEIIAPSHTFIATVAPFIILGAKPVFVEIDAETYTMDPEAVKKAVTPRTRAIVPVHLYGHPVDMSPLKEIGAEHHIPIIEDACQAHGAEYKGWRVGSMGDMAVFSFFPSKIMTVAGDGGMFLTNDQGLAYRAAMFKDAGRKRGEKYLHHDVGFNLRLSELHAAIGRIQLRRLPEWIDKRREVAMRYSEGLTGVGDIKVPKEAESAKHTYYVYTIETRDREALAKYLKDNGISTGIYYPTPVHMQPSIIERFGEISLPRTEICCDRILSLPMHPLLKKGDQERVINTIKDYFSSV